MTFRDASVKRQNLFFFFFNKKSIKWMASVFHLRFFSYKSLVILCVKMIKRYNWKWWSLLEKVLCKNIYAVEFEWMKQRMQINNKFGDSKFFVGTDGKFLDLNTLCMNDSFCTRFIYQFLSLFWGIRFS